MERRRRLRNLHEELKKVRPLYYRRSSGQVLPGFAVSVLNLALVLRPLRDVFEKTIDNPDLKLAQRYKEYLIIARLPEELQNLYASFSYPALKKRVLDSPAPEEELDKIDSELEQLIRGLSTGEFLSFDSSYTVINRLVSLCQHSFVSLLQMFDPALKSLENADPSIFQSVSGEDILQELLDFYFVLAGFDFSASVEKNIGLLLERLSRERAEEAKARLQKVLLRLQTLLAGNFTPETILILLRLIQKDPHFVPQSIQEESSFLEAFKNRLQINYQRSKERIDQQLRELAVREDLSRLFPHGQPQEIEGYREDIDQALQERDFDCFLHIRPLRIIKNYIRSHFLIELREPLKRLIVEGKFENRIFENMFTNTFYQCDGMQGRISQFEEELQGSSTQSIKKIPKYIELMDQGKPVYNMLVTVLETIEKESKQLVEEGANCFYNLCVILLEILNDAKLKTPERVSNIKTLLGGKTQEYLARVSQGYNHLFLFTKIMKNFTTIKQLSMTEGEPGI
ncbi:MAG: hypothetical protein JSV89_00100 [Spirochaetaceae bacterium]|nr:MAG: hypothetical protein JSV89_00100 [Spirochaetaceae bacterium]